jgi:fatty-acyl-CoA synthase
MINPTPSTSTKVERRIGAFDTFVEAVDYAAKTELGFNFYSARGDLASVLTYAELRDRAISIGRRFVGLGLAPGSRVAIIADTSPDFVSCFLGCQYAALLPVPLPMPTAFGGRDGYCQQLHQQMFSCGAGAAIAPAGMLELLQQAVKGLTMDFVGSHEDLAEIGEAKSDPRHIDPGDLCYLQYSSGSTRFPHGVSVTQRSLMANCRGIARDGVETTPDERCVSWLPMYHDMGLVGCFLAPIAAQVSVDLIATDDFARRPLLWLNVISKNRGTVSYSPSFGYELAARRAGPDTIASLDLSSWRAAGIGGDMIRPDVMRLFAETFAPCGFNGKAFLASYGLAECTLAVSFSELNKGLILDAVDEDILADENRAVTPRSTKRHARIRDFVNCGSVLPEHEMVLRDEHGRPVGEREIGRVYVRGPSVMSGYFGDAEATRQVLSADGWLDTGDMGYMVGDAVYITGRAKDMMIINGRNLWPQDIEWVVEQIPGIRTGDSAAISLPSEDSGEVPAVLVQCRSRTDADRMALINQIRRDVKRDVGVNCRVILVPPRSLPKTSSGKLRRSKARANLLTGALVPLGGDIEADTLGRKPAPATAG